MDIASLEMMVHFEFLFLLLFLFLPSLVIRFEPGDDSLLDRLFIPLIHTTIFIIGAVHILVLLKLLETMSMLGVCIAGFVYFWRRRYISDFGAYQTRMIVGLLDELESNKSLRLRLRHTLEALRQALFGWKQQFAGLLRTNPFPSLLILLVTGYAAYVRFSHSLEHYYFGADDPYYHMSWTKYVLKNVFFVDGVYSYGFESIMAALTRIYFIDLYAVVRFLGATGGVLIVLSVGYAVRKMGGNLYGVFFALFLYVVWGELPANTWRQMSSLPMEYGAIFCLPGVAFWTLFCRFGNRKHLFLAAECLMLTVLLHPFATVGMAVPVACIGLWYLPMVWYRKDLKPAVLYMGAGGFLGLLPMLVGLACGIPFYSDSLGYIQRNIGVVTVQNHLLQQKLAQWFAMKPDILYAIIGIIGLAVFVRYALVRSGLKERAIGLPVFLVTTAVYFLMDEANVFGLPVVMSLDRVGVFYAPFVAMTGGMAILAIGRVADAGRRRKVVSATLSLAFALAVAVSGQAVYAKSQNAEWPPVGTQLEYDDAVKSYLSIRDHFQAGNWTIVSPVEEFPMVEAFGFHTEMWQFVKDIQPDSTEEANRTFATENVFFYVEPIPIHPNAPYSVYPPITKADAIKPFPIPGPNDTDETTFYYRSENRITLQAKLYNWLEWYRRTYPDQMTIYLDTPKFKVYHLTEQIRKPLVPLPKLPAEDEGIW